MTLTVQIKALAHFGDLPLPKFETALAAGADLRAALDADMVLTPGERALVPTGFAMALPAGYEAQIRPRSGLAYKHGITCLNTPGTIDADYRGEFRDFGRGLMLTPAKLCRPSILTANFGRMAAQFQVRSPSLTAQAKC